MEAAKVAYVNGFHPMHPKVAWALEGLASLHEKRGEYTEALKAMREATEIRMNQEAKDAGKEQIQRELQKIEAKKINIEKKRTHVLRLQGAVKRTARKLKHKLLLG